MDKNELIPENNENNAESVPVEDIQENAELQEPVLAESTRKVENKSVDFFADDPIAVVAAQPEQKSKNLPVIIAACVLAVVVIIAAVMYFLNLSEKNEESDTPVNQTQEDESDYRDSALENFINEAKTEVITDAQGNEIDREEYIENLKQQAQEATTTLSTDIGNESPNQIVENTTASVGNGTQADDKEQVNKAEAQIKAFFDRSCYIQGAMYSNGTGDPLAMSLDGDNFEILTNLDGTEVSIMKVSGTMYIKRPATKQYVELTDTVMDMMGLDPDMFNISIGAADYSTMQSKLYATYDVTVNGEKGVCHEYVNNDQSFKFYSVDGQLKQIDTCDSAGNVDSQIIISYFSESIPGDQMTLKGYEKSSISAIFADMF